MGKYNDLTKSMRRDVTQDMRDASEPRLCGVIGCNNFADIVIRKTARCCQHYQLDADRSGHSAHVTCVKKSDNEPIIFQMREIFKNFRSAEVADNRRYHRMRKLPA